MEDAAAILQELKSTQPPAAITVNDAGQSQALGAAIQPNRGLEGPVTLSDVFSGLVRAQQLRPANAGDARTSAGASTAAALLPPAGDGSRHSHAHQQASGTDLGAAISAAADKLLARVAALRQEVGPTAEANSKDHTLAASEAHRAVEHCSRGDALHWRDQTAQAEQQLPAGARSAADPRLAVAALAHSQGNTGGGAGGSRVPASTPAATAGGIGSAKHEAGGIAPPKLRFKQGRHLAQAAALEAQHAANAGAAHAHKRRKLLTFTSPVLVRGA
jgi:hypothetical protein